jgi:hypothetical protein
MSALLSVGAYAQGPTQDSLSRYVYPLSAPIKTPPVTVDSSDLPDEAGWGDEAKHVVEMWFPIVCQLLATDKWHAPRQIKLVIKKHIDAPAYTVGSTITIDGQWITAHPDDLGMVVHELTHVIQNYPDGKDRPGWLVEGIADYVRWWRYEPEAAHPINKEKAHYNDSYRTTAAFLGWVSRKYNMGLVPALDRAMREGVDPMPVFQQLTGKGVDDLNTEWLAGYRG